MKGLNIRICSKCAKKFLPVNNTQRFCQAPCTSKNWTIEESNQAWVNRSKKKRSLNVRKDYGW
jgi:ribosome-binding protein aMBF1 (putative translation factor)